MTGLADRIARLSDEQRAALTARLATRSTGVIPRAPRSGNTIGLSFTQERIWFLEQFAPGTALQNMSGVARIPMRLDAKVFAACLDELVGRHETLRTAFAVRAGDPVGLVADRVTVPVRVLAGVSDEERERLFLDDAAPPFDLALAPLLRVNVAAGGPDECFVQLTMHHLISDGFSTGVFFAELGELYRARIAGTPPPTSHRCRCSSPTSPLAEHTRFDADTDGRQLSHWLEQLADAPQQLALQADRPRPARMTYRGRRLAVDVPADLVAGVHDLSRELGVTPFVTMLAGFVGGPQPLRRAGRPRCRRPRGQPRAVRHRAAHRAVPEHPGDALRRRGRPDLRRARAAGQRHRPRRLRAPGRAVRARRAGARSDTRPQPQPLFQTVFNFQFDRSARPGPARSSCATFPTATASSTCS